MPHRILVDIIQAGVVRTLVSQMCVPILEPDFSAGSVVLLIGFLGRDAMQVTDHPSRVT